MSYLFHHFFSECWESTCHCKTILIHKNLLRISNQISPTNLHTWTHFNAEQISTTISCNLFSSESGIGNKWWFDALFFPVNRTVLKTVIYLLQAFLEMASEEAAVTMVNYYTPVTPLLRSQPVYIQYSNHRELKTDNLPNQAVSIIFPFNRVKLYMTCISK